MALSPRTLQRRLKSEGTTFRREMHVERIGRAQRLLYETAATVAEIAFEVGYASPAHLSVEFRKLVGERPSQWRQRALRASRFPNVTAPGLGGDSDHA
jgi:AraC-like DNA-binding protein